MTSIYSRFYWRFGFQTRLYDLLVPEAYLKSMQRLVECIPASGNSIWLDVGCGSGLIIKYLRPRIRQGTYIGLDLLLDGLLRARIKAREENILNKVHLVQSNLSQTIPIHSNSVDIIIAHFSLYTVNPEKRGSIFREFRRLLRKGGTLAIVEPSQEYSATRIIEESISRVLLYDGAIMAWIKKWLFYPLTYLLGLKFIERQLKRGVWHALKSDDLCTEINLSGYKIKHIEHVYANSAVLVIANP